MIGISILSGAHLELVPHITKLMRENQLDDVVLVVGGVIPPQDIQTLKDMGVDQVFMPGSNLKEISEFIKQAVAKKRGQKVEHAS